jgi:hypothetical protein
MSYISINEVGSESFDRVTKILAGIPGGAQRAIWNALKRAGDTAKTEAGRFATAEYTITKGDFMRNTEIKTHMSREAGSVVSMNVRFRGKVLPLLTFNTKFSRDGLLHTQVKRHGSVETLKHVFTAKMHGPIGAYERIGKDRFPVEQKFGPSTGHMMQNDEVIKQMDETIRDTYEKRIEQEIYRILNGFGG